MSDDKPGQPGNTKGTRFQPGQSGNPGGRPRGYERRLREVVESQTVEHPKLGTISAFDAIVLEAVDKAVAGDKYAREWIGNYLMGKPKQHVELSGDVTTSSMAGMRDPSTLTDEELEGALAALRTLREAGMPVEPVEAPPRDSPTEH